MAESIQRSLRLLVIATVVLYLALAGAAFYVYSNASSNHDALCALRADVERRVQSSTVFLAEHPKGAGGIPAKAIKDGIANQRRTIAALSGLSCAD